MPDPSPAGAAPRRRWRPRLSLRATMILVLVVGLPLGWMARRAAIQRRAVARVQALGGAVSYADQRDPQGSFTGPHVPGGPAWLRRLVGDEPFQEVAEVAFFSPDGRYRVDDGSIGVLNDFDRLESLAFAGGDIPEDSPHQPITAAGLAKLGGLRRLRNLTMHRANVDEATMRLLPRWPSLEVVQIDNGHRPLPAEGYQALGDLPRLKRLQVRAAGPAPPGDLAPLARLAHLEIVSIEPSPRGDAGLAGLAAPSLRTLQLANTALTEPTLAALARLPNLEMLYFDGSRLSREALHALSGARRLASLIIDLRGHGDGGDAEPLRPGDEVLDALRAAPLLVFRGRGLDATDAGVARFLDAHPGLQWLEVGGQGVTDASAARFAAPGQLQAMILHDTGLTDAGLARLAAAPGLVLLGLDDNARLTAGGIAALRAMPKLERLTLRRRGLDSATLGTIRAALPGIQLDQFPDDPR